MIGSKKITVQFKLNWLVVIVVFAVLLIVTYIFVPTDSRPSLIFAVSVLAGAALLIGAINALDSRYAQLQQSKAVAALEYIHRWTDPHFFHAKVNGRDIIQALKGKTEDEQYAYVKQEPTRLANLIDVLNFFESMSIAIQKDIADDEIVKLFFRSILTEYWHGAEGFIKKRRAERNNARLAQEIEWLYERWKV